MSSNTTTSSTNTQPQGERDRDKYADDFFMAISYLASLRSKDPKQVGACIALIEPETQTHIQNLHLIAMGYNGMPDGCAFKDREMKWDEKKKIYECHAELNAIISGCRGVADLSLCTLYITHFPCVDCRKLIAQSKIKTVVCDQEFDGNNAVKEHLVCWKYSPEKKYQRVHIDLLEHKACISHTLNEMTGENVISNELGKSKIREGPRDIKFPLDDYFMALAFLASTQSKDQEKKLGACVVLEEPRRVLSVGYNGNEFCAVSSAIMSAFRHHADLTSSILYTTCKPCNKCAQMIIQSGIKIIVCVCDNKKDKNRSPENRLVDIFNRAKIAVCEYACHTKQSNVYLKMAANGPSSSQGD